jgi:hypothetical protein
VGGGELVAAVEEPRPRPFELPYLECRFEDMRVGGVLDRGRYSCDRPGFDAGRPGAFGEGPPGGERFAGEVGDVGERVGRLVGAVVGGEGREGDGAGFEPADRVRVARVDVADRDVGDEPVVRAGSMPRSASSRTASARSLSSWGESTSATMTSWSPAVKRACPEIVPVTGPAPAAMDRAASRSALAGTPSASPV